MTELPSRPARAILATFAARSGAGLRTLWPWLAAPLLYGLLVGWFVWRPFDVARGRPFHVSSAQESFPSHGKVTISGPDRPLLATTVEASPWVEIDLGRVRELSSVDVRNRSDCCADHALPLLVEVRSDEHEPWTLRVRRDRPFVTWTAEIPGTSARYVRLRVPRETALRLEGIAVY